jgi:pimeloyl-ACP methyl ester carboxylesterase
MVADVLSILDAVGHSTVDVIGYSMGGYLTVNLLHLAPGRVRRAVVAGVGETYFSFWCDRNEIIAQALLADDTETIADPLAQEFRTFSTRAKNDLKALAACMRRDRLVLTPEDLRGITHPVLVVCGERDTISGRPEPLAELFAAGEAVSVPRKDHHSTVGDLVFKRAARDFLAR